MRPLHPIVCFLLTTSLATAQCIVPSVIDVGPPTCSGFDVIVTFTGGPPMTSYWAAIFVDGTEYQTGGADPGGYTYHVPWTTDALITNIEVTAADLNGCQSLGSWSGSVPRPPMDLQYSVSLDCGTGLRTLRWTNANLACGSAGAHTYTVNGNSGTVAGGFTQENASTWRYNTLLPAGTHSFGIDATPSSYPGYNCGNSTQCWALSPTGLVTIQSPSVTPGDCGVNFHLQAFLDGAYPGGVLMNDALRSAGLLPTIQPYTMLGYTYTGSPSGLTIAPALLTTTGANAIVDWVVVELRNAATPATVVYSKPALLQRDGDVIDTDGNVYVNMPVAAGTYHVALRHRNHLAVMTGAPVSLSADPANATIDFRSAAQGTYGLNARVLKSGNYCLWAGDATGNGQVRYTGSANDRDPILIAVGSTMPNNTLTNVYDRRDTNLDGVIKYTGAANDRDILLTNVGSTTPNNTRTQQLP